MPVYEYECRACGHAFEEWQKITEAAIRTCPKCAKDEVERLISQTAFQLKGGGWYKDLYSSGKSKSKDSDGAAAKSTDKADKSEKADKGGDKGGDKSGEKKAESKSPASGGGGGGGGSSGGSSSGGGSGGGSGSSGGGGSSSGGGKTSAASTP